MLQYDFEIMYICMTVQSITCMKLLFEINSINLYQNENGDIKYDIASATSEPSASERGSSSNLCRLAKFSNFD